MNREQKRYRQKHPKCKWCKYYKHNYKEVGCQPFSWYNCELKDKPINENFNKIRAKFCKYYNVKGDVKENEISTSETN